MTAVTHGADPEALRRLAEEMLNHAEYTLGVGIRTQQALQTLQWTGPDAERARRHWETVELPYVREVTQALAQAAGLVLEQAREQLAASDAGAGPAVPVGAAASNGGAVAATPTSPERRDPSALAGRVRAIVDVLTNGPELAQVAAVVATGGRGAAAMTKGQYAFVRALIGASKPVVGGVVRTAGAAGTALNVVDAGVGLYRGDAVQATSGLGGLAAGAVAGPAGSAAWGGGWFIGTRINEAIEGTSYGDALERRNEMAFDTLGVGGLLIVPGNLALAGWDMLTGADEPDPPRGGGR